MIIIGIAGGTGSGKTTVVKRILERIPQEQVSLIPQDSYYLPAPPGVPLEELKKMNYDHPDAFDWDLLTQQVEALKAGETVEQPTYSVLTCDRAAETVTIKPTKVILIEGIMALYRKELRDLMDLKIYVDADADDRLIRVIRRDVIERGRTARVVMDRYLQVLKPMHREFIEPTKEFADIIIPQGGENERAIHIMQVFLERMLRGEE